MYSETVLSLFDELLYLLIINNYLSFIKKILSLLIYSAILAKDLLQINQHIALKPQKHIKHLAHEKAERGWDFLINDALI